MDDIEEFEYSIELPIGIRFYFKNRLYEVIESNSRNCCQECAFIDESYDLICQFMNCGGSYYERLDRKLVSFKEVEKTEDDNNG